MAHEGPHKYSSVSTSPNVCVCVCVCVDSGGLSILLLQSVSCSSSIMTSSQLIASFLFRHTETHRHTHRHTHTQSFTLCWALEPSSVYLLSVQPFAGC